MRRSSFTMALRFAGLETLCVAIFVLPSSRVFSFTCVPPSARTSFFSSGSSCLREKMPSFLGSMTRDKVGGHGEDHAVGGRVRQAPSMVYDLFNPQSRSQLKGRTYASDPSLFRSIDNLNKVSGWTDPLIFSDQAALSPSADQAILSSFFRAILVFGGFLLFPELTSKLTPLVFTEDGSLRDQVRVGLTSSFLPGISLLFGALFSYTISLLINRQATLEEVVNAELASLSSLVLHLQDYFRLQRNELEASMEAAWRHTDTLIFQSRYQEIFMMIQDDPLQDLMRLVISVDDRTLAEDSHEDKSGVHRDQLGFLRSVLSEMFRLRTLRLSNEGRVLPSAHFGILLILVSMLLFGFALASVQPPGPDGAAVSAALESRVLFSLLLFSFSLLMEFALDLTNPFLGRYKVRRTTTTGMLIKIRNEIVAVMGEQRMNRFEKDFGRQKRKAFRDFVRDTGVELPVDEQM